jgi:hypothetical protein
MAGEEIKFTITPKGVKFESSNFTGGSCLTALEDFKAFMLSKGVVITDTNQEIKPELYLTDTTELTQEY